MPQYIGRQAPEDGGIPNEQTKFLARFRRAKAKSIKVTQVSLEAGKNQIVGEDRAQHTEGTQVLVYADEDFVARGGYGQESK